MFWQNGLRADKTQEAAGRDEQALMTTIAGLVVVLVLVIQKISELFDLIKSLFSL